MLLKRIPHKAIIFQSLDTPHGLLFLLASVFTEMDWVFRHYGARGLGNALVHFVPLSPFILHGFFPLFF